MKKLNDLLSFFYASAAVIYVSARDFGLIGTSIVLAVVLFMLYSTRIKAGCSAFVMLPFLLFSASLCPWEPGDSILEVRCTSS